MSNTYKMPDINSEVVRLRRQVAKQLDAARHNEQVHNRFQAIELALLSAQDFGEIAGYLQGDFMEAQNLGAVSLVLLDPDNEISSALCSTNGQKDCPPGMMLTHDLIEIEFLQSMGKFPFLSRYDVAEHQWLFKNVKEKEGSIVVLPFVRRDQLIGCLALFSRDLSRYQSGAATEFLQRLAAVTAICVENCLNYEQLRRLSLTDALTGLANRRELEKWMNIEISRSLREALPLSCLYLDVDFFKKVNDNYGHDIGDQVLQKVSQVMLDAVRTGDIVARYGGEEFIVILPGITGLIAIETAERVRCAVADANIEIEGQSPLNISISIGLASFIPKNDSIGDSGEIAEQLLTSADRALLKAKEQGRNRVVVD
ncbi:MAG: sensor domain-containing diguanylate cyclase [Gammaproteobacteria bacterium]|nr:sensor domain-containing diguanylate cyclase [Gammaproteobacteria bacterium]